MRGEIPQIEVSKQKMVETRTKKSFGKQLSRELESRIGIIHQVKMEEIDWEKL